MLRKKAVVWLTPLLLLFREKSRFASAIRAGKPPSCTPPLAFRLFASTPPSAVLKLAFAPTLFLTKKIVARKLAPPFRKNYTVIFAGVFYESFRLRRLFMLRKKAVVWLTPLLLLFREKSRFASAIRAGKPPSYTPPLAFRLFASTPPSAASKLIFAPTLFLRKHAAAIQEGMEKVAALYGDQFRTVFKSITGDNGSEFAGLDEKQNLIVCWLFPKV